VRSGAGLVAGIGCDLTVAAMNPGLTEYVLDHWPIAVVAVGVTVFLGVWIMSALTARAARRAEDEDVDPDVVAAVAVEVGDGEAEYVPGVGWQVTQQTTVPDGATIREVDEDVLPAAAEPTVSLPPLRPLPAPDPAVPVDTGAVLPPLQEPATPVVLEGWRLAAEVLRARTDHATAAADTAQTDSHGDEQHAPAQAGPAVASPDAGDAQVTVGSWAGDADPPSGADEIAHLEATQGAPAPDGEDPTGPEVVEAAPSLDPDAADPDAAGAGADDPRAPAPADEPVTGQIPLTRRALRLAGAYDAPTPEPVREPAPEPAIQLPPYPTRRQLREAARAGAPLPIPAPAVEQPAPAEDTDEAAPRVADVAGEPVAAEQVGLPAPVWAPVTDPADDAAPPAPMWDPVTSDVEPEDGEDAGQGAEPVESPARMSWRQRRAAARAARRAAKAARAAEAEQARQWREQEKQAEQEARRQAKEAAKAARRAQKEAAKAARRADATPDQPTAEPGPDGPGTDPMPWAWPAGTVAGEPEAPAADPHVDTTHDVEDEPGATDPADDAAPAQEWGFPWTAPDTPDVDVDRQAGPEQDDPRVAVEPAHAGLEPDVDDHAEDARPAPADLGGMPGPEVDLEHVAPGPVAPDPQPEPQSEPESEPEPVRISRSERRAAVRAAQRAERQRKAAEQARARQAEADRKAAERWAQQRAKAAAKAEREAARKAEADRRAAQKEATRAEKARAKAARSRRAEDSEQALELRRAAEALRAAAAAAAAAGEPEIGQAGSLPDPAEPEHVTTSALEDDGASYVIGASRRAHAAVDHTAFDLPEPVPAPLPRSA
jgi:hypothetical protein